MLELGNKGTVDWSRTICQQRDLGGHLPGYFLGGREIVNKPSLRMNSMRTAWLTPSSGHDTSYKSVLLATALNSAFRQSNKTNTSLSAITQLQL